MKISETYIPELTTAIQTILRMFTGYDGGGDYVVFMDLMRNISKKALDGDPIAQKAINCVLKFETLIKISTGELKASTD